MKLIVGLGNPGEKYEKSRHNTGFLAVDRLADKLDVRVNRRAFNALIGKTTLNGEQVIIMKPQTYMNLSGEAVGKAVRYYKLDHEKDVLIIYDDLDLPVGKIRLREKGASGGHNGIRSIIAHLSSKNFCRIRIGIGGEGKEDTVDYVLSSMYGEQLAVWLEGIERASEAAYEFIREPFQKVMNKYNQK